MIVLLHPVQWRLFALLIVLLAILQRNSGMTGVGDRKTCATACLCAWYLVSGVYLRTLFMVEFEMGMGMCDYASTWLYLNRGSVGSTKYMPV